MKKLHRNILFGIGFLVVLIACTKEITEDAIQRSFSIEFEEEELTALVNIPKSASFTISGPGAVAQEDFRLKYNVTQGAGFLVIDDEVIAENELINLAKGASFSLKYIGIQVGEHKVSVALRDSRNEEKEVQLSIEVKDTAFELEVEPDTPNTYVNGIVDLDFRIIEAVEADYTLTYNFIGVDEDGAGAGTISADGILVEPGKEVTIENKEKFTLEFNGKKLGVAKLSLIVKSNLGKDVQKEIEITITETPDFEFITIAEGVDPSTDQVETFIQLPVTVSFKIEETVGSSSYTGVFTSPLAGSFIYNEIMYASGQEIPMEPGVSSGTYIGQEVGEHTIVFAVNNANTIPVTKESKVTIICKDPGVELPVIALLGDNPLIWDVNEEFIDPGFTVVDNDDPEIESKVQVTGEVDITVLGSYELNYNVTDVSGNVAETQIRQVEVKDRIAPVISLNGGDIIVLPVGSSWQDPATATDNYESNDEITQKIEYGGSFVGTDAVGEYERTYNVKDASANPAEEVKRVIKVAVVDPPVITLNDADIRQVIQKGEEYVELGATVNDGSELTIDASAVNTAVPTQIGYDVIYAAKNDGGTTEVIRKVFVNAPPVIMLAGAEEIQINGSPAYTDAGATATDEEDGSLTPTIATNNVVSNKLGDYIVRYSVTDSDNKTVIKDRKVKVIDTEKPMLSLVGNANITINQGQAYNEQGATVTDNIAAPISVAISPQTLNTAIPGTYTITYNAQDTSGNKATQITRTITVNSIANFNANTGVLAALSGASVKITLKTPFVQPGRAARCRLFAKLSNGNEINRIFNCWDTVNAGSPCTPGEDSEEGSFVFTMPSGNVSLEVTHTAGGTTAVENSYSELEIEVSASNGAAPYDTFFVRLDKNRFTIPR